MKIGESFILGLCQCDCSTEIDIFSPKSKGRKTGFLRRYVDRTHVLRARNQMGENNVNWKGGKPKQDKDGYWLIYDPDHPYRNIENRVFAHRLIYEHYLSILFDEEIYLPKGSEIHHINEDKEDNSLINLQYMNTRKDHKQEHLVDYTGVKCKTCGSKYTPIRSDSGSNRPKWCGNEVDGYQCVSCSKKEYWIKNKEKIKEYRKKNEEKFRESNKNRSREYYKNNREVLLEKEKKRYWDKRSVTTKK